MKFTNSEKSNQSINSDDEDSYDIIEGDECQDDENVEYKGALKITRIKNRRYIRMPNFAKRSVNILKNWLN
jgi:hypothetical protein